MYCVTTLRAVIIFAIAADIELQWLMNKRAGQCECMTERRRFPCENSCARKSAFPVYSASFRKLNHIGGI